MELFTTGRVIYPEYQVALVHIPNERFASDCGSRFRIILIEDGAGILSLDERQEVFVAPALFCLNEQEEPHLHATAPVRAQSVYFHPNAINSIFTFDNIRCEAGFSLTQSQDTHMLRVFLKRTGAYGGQLMIGPVTAQRLRSLFADLDSQLLNQPDDSWPCRSRSYLLELLFVIDRLFDLPEPHSSPRSETTGSHHSPEELDPILLYLHAHYREKITIGSLARRFNTNRTTLTEHFRETTGVPVMTYLTRLRIRLATSMLHDTQLPVYEVAERVGYTDLTHFGRTFRKYTGITPSEYRERYCWMLK